MKKLWLHIILAFLLINMNFSSFGQQVSATLNGEKHIIADTFSIDLQVTTSNESIIIWPEIGLNIGDIEVNHEASSDVDSFKTKESLTLNQHLVLTVFDTGFFPIPPFEFIIDQDTLKTTPQLVQITGIALDTTNLDAKPIKGTLDAPLTIMDIIWPYGVIAFGSFMLLAIGIIIFFLTKKKPQPVYIEPKITLPAHVWARKELEKLKQEELWQSGNIKEYYIRISEIFRQYIELRYKKPALESTTIEIMDQLMLIGIEQTLLEKVKSTLTLADYVKFAKAKPLVHEHESCFETVLEFVEATKIEEVKESKDL